MKWILQPLGKQNHESEGSWQNTVITKTEAASCFFLTRVNYQENEYQMTFIMYYGWRKMCIHAVST